MREPRSLAVDFVWVGLVSGARLTLADVDEDAWRQVGDVVGYLPPDSVAWLREIYQHRSSYRIQDLRAEEAGEIPAAIRETLLGLGASGLCAAPAGAAHRP